MNSGRTNPKFRKHHDGNSELTDELDRVVSEIENLTHRLRGGERLQLAAKQMGLRVDNDFH